MPSRGWLPSNSWINAKLTANVNLNQTCNAYWNGSSVNFFRSGGGCANTGELPGVSLHEPVPDWSRFQTLVIDVANPDPVDLSLTVRVHDQRHNKQFADRFNRSFALRAGERREIRIPLDDIRRGPRQRLMDMRHISDITLFRGDNQGSRRLRVYTIRLE